MEYVENRRIPAQAENRLGRRGSCVRNTPPRPIEINASPLSFCGRTCIEGRCAFLDTSLQSLDDHPGATRAQRRRNRKHQPFNVLGELDGLPESRQPRRTHPAWRLLAADHAPLVASFLDKAFPPPQYPFSFTARHRREAGRLSVRSLANRSEKMRSPSGPNNTWTIGHRATRAGYGSIVLTTTTNRTMTLRRRPERADRLACCPGPAPVRGHGVASDDGIRAAARDCGKYRDRSCGPRRGVGEAQGANRTGNRPASRWRSAPDGLHANFY